jgi:hypothetical protein
MECLSFKKSIAERAKDVKSLERRMRLLPSLSEGVSAAQI